MCVLLFVYTSLHMRICLCLKLDVNVQVDVNFEWVNAVSLRLCTMHIWVCVSTVSAYAD